MSQTLMAETIQTVVLRCQVQIEATRRRIACRSRSVFAIFSGAGALGTDPSHDVVDARERRRAAIPGKCARRSARAVPR